MLLFFLALALLLQPTIGQSPGAFIKPSPGSLDHDYSKNPKYELDNLMRIQWETDDANRGFDMILWQDQTRKYETLSSRSAKFPCQLVCLSFWILWRSATDNLRGNGNYQWKVTTNLSLTDGHAFFLQMVDTNNYTNTPANYFVSRYFNITEGNTRRKASGTSTTTITDSTSTIHITLTRATSTAPSTTLRTFASASSTASVALPTTIHYYPVSSGLTSEARLGIGLGVGLGCTFLICMAVIIWYIRRRLANISPGSNVPPPWTPMSHAPVPTQDATPQYQKPTIPAEVPGSKPRTPVEVPSDPRTESRLQHQRFELEPWYLVFLFSNALFWPGCIYYEWWF